MENIKKLKELFYNPKTGFISSNKLKKKADEEGIKLTQAEINEFYRKQPVNQLMHRTTKPKKYNSITANYPSEIYQMDIMVYDRFKYNNYQYMLCVIDVYSRYASVRAMTNRRLETIIENFESIINEMGIPKLLEADNEFNKEEFNKFIEKKNINVIYSSPYEINKNPIVERFNGTLATMLQKVRIATKKYDWYNYLSDVVYNYNNTKHSTIKNTPESVFTGEKFNEQKINIVSNPFKINDKVRIIRKRSIFSKSDEIKFSKEIYNVEEIKNNKIKLSNIKKLYKPYELKSIADIDEDMDVEEPKTMTKQNKYEQMMKREDLKFDNILPSRTRNKINIVN